MIDIEGLTVTAGDSVLLHDVSLHIGTGSWTGIVGPNGAGKSTLLRTLAGLPPAPVRGTIGAEGRPISARTTRERARLLALVVQDPVIPPGMRVFDYTLLGRTPHIAPFAAESAKDCDVVRSVLAQLNLERLASRALHTLSGGERQRVLLARALAQQAPILLLDEPTAALDVGHSQEALELIDDLRRSEGLTVVSALHDLTLAAQFCERIVLLGEGCVVADGLPEAVLTKERIDAAFGADVDVQVGRDGTLSVVPRRARARPKPGS